MLLTADSLVGFVCEDRKYYNIFLPKFLIFLVFFFFVLCGDTDKKCIRLGQESVARHLNQPGKHKLWLNSNDSVSGFKEL